MTGTTRAYTRRLARDLDKAENLARFALASRPTCPDCGADLQGDRCPWANTSRLPGPDGRTYCAWPRDRPAKPPAGYTISRSRAGPR